MPRPPAARAWSRRHRSAVCVVLAVTCSVLSGARPALAHTSLVSTTPGPGGVVVDPVEAVTLVFSQPVSPEQVQVVVTGPDGADVAVGPARVSGRTVSRSVRMPAMSGGHRLAYRVLAEDGHPITGEVPFEVALPATGPAPTGPTATVPPTATDSTQASSRATRPPGTILVPALVAVLGAVALLLTIGAARAARRPEAGR